MTNKTKHGFLECIAFISTWCTQIHLLYISSHEAVCTYIRSCYICILCSYVQCNYYTHADWNTHHYRCCQKRSEESWPHQIQHRDPQSGLASFWLSLQLLLPVSADMSYSTAAVYILKLANVMHSMHACYKLNDIMIMTFWQITHECLYVAKLQRLAVCGMDPHLSNLFCRLLQLA